jgi:hypothetical protein
MKTFFNFLIIGFLVGCTNLFWIPSGEANDIPHLATRSGSQTRSLQAVNGRLNTQHLTINRDGLKALALNRLERVIIPVIEDDVIFLKTSQKIRKKTATWTGRDKTGKTRVLLTLGGDHFFARVVADGQIILFKPTGIDNQVISYIADKSFEVPLIDDAVSASLEPQEHFRGVQSADDGSRIDVMVLYTSGMATAYPGSQVDTRIQHLVDVANSAFNNSNINTQFNLVHSAEVDYPDDSPSGMGQALDDLTDNIGEFENVENLRTTYGADQVTLLRRFVDEGCGMAWLIDFEWADLAYALVHDGSKTDGSGFYCSDLTYVHEVGHNLGCAHDRANAGGSGRFPYSYGYQEPTGKFHTVMSYECPGPGGCQEIEYFSNPAISYNGDPTGIAGPNLNSADNARTINQTRVEVAGFRDSVQPVVTVTSPDGDEVWRRGASKWITWTTSNLSGNVRIELFKGGILNTTINPDAPDTGSRLWTVPESQALGSNYRIRISSIASPDVFDESDGDFSIDEELETKATPWIPLLLLDD